MFLFSNINNRLLFRSLLSRSYRKSRNLKSFLILSLIIFNLISSDPAYAQKRQRSKSKTKTTAVTKSKSKSSSAPKTSAEAKKQQQETQKEIQLTEEQIRLNEANVKKSLADLGKIDQDIAASNKKIKDLNSKVASLNSQISSLEEGIASNEKDLETLRAEYLKAVKKMRVTKKNKSTLAFLFSSNSLNQAMRRMRYLREFSAWRGRQTDEINAKTADLKNQRDALAKAMEEQSNALALQKNAVALLDKQHAQQEAILADLKKNGAALQAHLKKKQAEATELGKQISLLIAEEQRKAAEEEARRRAIEEQERRKAAEEQARNNTKSSNNSKESSNTDYASARKRTPRNKDNNNPLSNSFADMKGRLPYPSTGTFAITSPFGRHAMPDLPDVEYDNPGIDAETDAGASARAVFKGKVSGVYLLPGYNTVVIVNHGNYYTVYGNISSPSVKNGDSVESGTILGRLALNDDDSSHASIHFEVWKNREKLNPQQWLR